MRHRTFVAVREKLVYRATDAVAAGTAYFVLPLLPFLSRTQVRLYWEHDSGPTGIDTARTDVGTATLWAALCSKGKLKGQLKPQTNLVGTYAAPLTILSSSDLGLWGYQFTVDTVGTDETCESEAAVYGKLAFTPSASVLTAGYLHVEQVYQTLDRITDAEFEGFRARLHPHVRPVDILV
jgi:hypothetical protein